MTRNSPTIRTECFVVFSAQNGYANAPQCYVIRTVHCLSGWTFSWCDTKQPHCSSFCTVRYRTTEQPGTTVRFPSIAHRLIFGGYSGQGVKLAFPSSAAFMTTKIRTDFYVMTPYSLVGGYWRVGGANCFHLQGSFTSSLKMEAYFSFELFLPLYIVQYAVYSTQYTVYSTQYTVYSIQCTIYSIQYTVYNIQYIIYSTHYAIYSVQYTVYNIQYTVCNIQFTIYSIQYTVYNIPYTVHSIQYTIYSMQYTIYIYSIHIQCTICSIQYTIYSMQYTVYNTQYTIYNMQYTVYNIQCTRCAKSDILLSYENMCRL